MSPRSYQLPLALGTTQSSPVLKTTPWLLVGCCCTLAALFWFFQHPAEREHFSVRAFLSVERAWEDQGYNWSLVAVFISA